MKVGDKVVCVKTSKKFGTFKGQEYIVQDKKVCSCGKISLDVGIRDVHGYLAVCYTTCRCGVKTFCGVRTSALIWQKANRFVPYERNNLSRKLAEEFIEQDSKVREVEVERVFSLNESF